MQFLGRPLNSVNGRVQYSIIDFEATAGDPCAIEAWVSQWLGGPEMSELLDAFGHSLTAGSVRDRLHQLEQITREIFDFRQGGERWEARTTTFDEKTTAIADSLISRLYRQPTGPAGVEIGPVDHALVLGGRLNSCLLRGELLALLLEEGLCVGNVWGLGSRRPITPDEMKAAATIGAGELHDELDAMAAALKHTLGLPTTGRPLRDNANEVRVLSDQPVRVTGLAAACGEGKARATTSDTYRFFLETASNLDRDTHLLVVTSAIHAPFQHAQAIGELGIPTGATITSVGAHISTSSQSLVRNQWTTAEWLQEIRSAVWSMKQMYEALILSHPELVS